MAPHLVQPAPYCRVSLCRCAPDARVATRVQRSGKGFEMSTNVGVDSFANIQPLGRESDLVLWTDESGLSRSATAGPELRNVDFTKTRPARKPKQWRQRRNYQGLYWFESVASHVWFESLFERNALMVWDHSQEVVAIASQPMKIEFGRRREGVTSHFPDFFAHLRSGDHVLFDVRPADRVARNINQFRHTAAICDLVGWRYEMFSSINALFELNLRWIGGYRFARYAPDDSDCDRLRNICAAPIALGDAAQIFNFRRPFLSLPYIYHLLWRGVLACDLASQLTMDSEVSLAGGSS